MSGLRGLSPEAALGLQGGIMTNQWRYLGPTLTFRSARASSLSYCLQVERLLTDDWYTGLSDSLKRELGRL